MTKLPKAIPAATIILGRQNHNSFEIFMVLRHKKMEFASSAYVFPGGKVDPSDMDDSIYNLCNTHNPLNSNNLFFKVAAIRETFEEAGILMARNKGEKELIGKDQVDSLQKYRTLLNNNKITMSEFVKKEGISLACDLLVPFAHWITPVNLPKRFDTHFFLAKAPHDQDANHDGIESVNSVWISPLKILKDAKNKSKSVLFPTKMNISKLSVYNSIDDAIKKIKQDKIVTVIPEIVTEKKGVFLHIPKEAGYKITKELIFLNS